MNFWMNAMISGEFPEKRNLFILGNFAQFLSARLNSVRIFIHRLIMFQKDFFFTFISDNFLETSTHQSVELEM